jgi:predicted O-methyltransferase YrrM
MPRILDKKIEAYLNGLLPKRDPVLADLERYARRHDVPIIEAACGRLLYLLTQIAGVKRIFEMGSAIGYSTLWFARAAGEGAEVFYTDGDPANAERARKNFERARVADRVRILVGNALELIDTVPGEFDLIFVDVDKHQYPSALEKSLPRLRRGGLLVADNALWSGLVAGRAKDINTRSIQAFNDRMYGVKELFPVIVPLRDGVAVCRKL